MQLFGKSAASSNLAGSSIFVPAESFAWFCFDNFIYRPMPFAAIAQPVERILGKDEVASSNLASSSNKTSGQSAGRFLNILPEELATESQARSAFRPEDYDHTLQYKNSSCLFGRSCFIKLGLPGFLPETVSNYATYCHGGDRKISIGHIRMNHGVISQ